jgi:hypothetical protein
MEDNVGIFESISSVMTSTAQRAITLPHENNEVIDKIIKKNLFRSKPWK